MIASSSTGDKKTKARSFPKLMKSKGYTVLFVSKGQGTVIHKSELTIGNIHMVGDYIPDWIMSQFEDTDDTITLCSKEK